MKIKLKSLYILYFRDSAKKFDIKAKRVAAGFVSKMLNSQQRQKELARKLNGWRHRNVGTPQNRSQSIGLLKALILQDVFFDYKSPLQLSTARSSAQ